MSGPSRETAGSPDSRGCSIRPVTLVTQLPYLLSWDTLMLACHASGKVLVFPKPSWMSLYSSQPNMPQPEGILLDSDENFSHLHLPRASLVAQTVNESACNAGDLGFIPGLLERPPGEGNGYLLQYSCLENSMDRGAWWATVHGVTKSQTQLSG